MNGCKEGKRSIKGNNRKIQFKLWNAIPDIDGEEIVGTFLLTLAS